MHSNVKLHVNSLSSEDEGDNFPGLIWSKSPIPASQFLQENHQARITTLRISFTELCYLVYSLIISCLDENCAANFIYHI